MPNGKRVDFNDLSQRLPDRIILDANILINQFKPRPSLTTSSTRSIDLYDHSKAFFERLKTEKYCKPYVPQTVIRECCNRLTQAHLDAYALANSIPTPHGATSILKQDPNHMQRSQLPQRLQWFFTIVKSARIRILQPSDFSQSIIKTEFEPDILNYTNVLKMLYEDASILVEAERFGVKKVATVDGDFKRILGAGFDLYTSRIL